MFFLNFGDLVFHIQRIFPWSGETRKKFVSKKMTKKSLLCLGALIGNYASANVVMEGYDVVAYHSLESTDKGVKGSSLEVCSKVWWLLSSRGCYGV